MGEKTIWRDSNTNPFQFNNKLIPQLQVFDGITILFHRYLQNNFRHQIKLSQNTIRIDYNYRGFVQIQNINGKNNLYFEPTLLKVDSRTLDNNKYLLSDGIYEGITILIDPQQSFQDIRDLLKYQFNCQMILRDQEFFFIKSNFVKGLFDDLKLPLIENNPSFLRLKIAELILYLTNPQSLKDIIATNYLINNNNNIEINIIKYLKEHIEEHITLDMIANRFKISITKIKKIFKEQYNCSVTEYFMQLKMQHAINLLINSNLKIATIANDVGYENPSKFSQTFKNKLQVTPLEYRKKFQIK